MATKDPPKAYARLLAAHRRIIHGLEVQHRRITSRAAGAPKLSAGSGIDVTDLRGDPGNDIDYYVYELARLQDLAKEIGRVFGDPAEVADALGAFDRAIPALRRLRNPLTHPTDDERLDAVAWFDSVVKLQPGGAVEYLVDPRYGHHDAALELGRVLSRYLDAGYQATRDAD
jgi:hypothetical protein